MPVRYGLMSHVSSQAILNTKSGGTVKVAERLHSPDQWPLSRRQKLAQAPYLIRSLGMAVSADSPSVSTISHFVFFTHSRTHESQQQRPADNVLVHSSSQGVMPTVTAERTSIL